MLSESLRQEVQAARDAIQRQQDEERQGYDFVDELCKKFDFDQQPKEQPQIGDETDKRYQSVRSTMPSIRHRYPWKQLVLVAAEKLSTENGLEPKAKTIYELINTLPKGCIDGNDPDGMTHELEHVRQSAERIKRILNECLGEVKPTKQDVPSEFETAPSETEEKGQSQTVDNVVVKLMSVYTNNLTDERFVKVQSVLASGELTANDKLEAIDRLMPIPPSASAETLGKLLGVSKQAVAKLDWWNTNRKDKQTEAVGKRESKLKERAKLQEYNEVDEFD